MRKGDRVRRNCSKLPKGLKFKLHGKTIVVAAAPNGGGVGVIAIVMLGLEMTWLWSIEHSTSASSLPGLAVHISSEVQVPVPLL